MLQRRSLIGCFEKKSIKNNEKNKEKKGKSATPVHLGGYMNAACIKNRCGIKVTVV